MSVRITDSKLNVFNPSTGCDITSIPMTTKTELRHILLRARDIADQYNHVSFAQRKKLMLQFRKGIVKHMDEFIEIICSETGKKEVEGLMELYISLEHLQQATKQLHEALGKKLRRVGMMKTKKAWIEYEPMGVAGIISPWNYPLILTLSPIVEALLAGNSVVLKPSEHTPLTARLLKKVWDQSTNQTDLFQIIYGAGEVGHELVISDCTDIICFTGSTAIGKNIALDCASCFKPVILELGGKDPMIILDDADLERSVNAALWGGLSNSGQTCISVEHIFAHEKIYPIIVDKLADKIQKMSSGIDQSDLGSISVYSGIEKIQSHIDETREKSTVIEGIGDGGYFLPPTLVINPSIESQIMKEETFGPVMTIHPFSNDEEAIKLANMAGYGLSASIFGKNYGRMKSISKRIKVGSIIYNDVLTHYGIADLPFGGMGLSGMGKVHGKEGIRAFSVQKSFLNNRIALKSEFWWFEKREKFGKIIRRWIKWRYS